MITIELTEEVKNMSEMENLLEEVLRLVRTGTKLSWNPDFEITGSEEIDDEG